MKRLPELNGNIFSALLGTDDNGAFVKTLTSSSQNVFTAAFPDDELALCWAEEDFSYSISSDPIATTTTSHRVPANFVIPIIIPAGNNMAIIGTDNAKIFYLSK